MLSAGVYAQGEAVYVRVDHNASLVCPRMPEGVSPQTPLVWWKDDVLVQPQTGRGSSGTPQRIWMRNSQLWITRVVADDSGEYACGVQGQRRPSGTVKLFVQDVPDPPGKSTHPLTLILILITPHSFYITSFHVTIIL